MDVEDIARGECPNKSIDDYGDSDVKDECKNGKASELKNASARPVTLASPVIHGGLVREDGIAAYNVKIAHLEDHKHTEVNSCTGSLIAPQYVLTAAHCNVKLGENVYIGEYLDMPGEEHAVTKAIVHGGYAELRSKHGNRLRAELHDVQLLYLATPVKNAAKRIVTLNADCHRPVSCRHSRVTGYGELAKHDCKRDVLRSTVVNIVGHDECYALLKGTHEGLVEHCLDESPHICATHDLCGSGLCRGDSGGPLVVTDKDTQELVQLGISSFSVGDCGARNDPKVYTRVSAYKAWIYRHTNGTAKFDPPHGSVRNTDCHVQSVSDECKSTGKNDTFPDDDFRCRPDCNAVQPPRGRQERD